MNYNDIIVPEISKYVTRLIELTGTKDNLGRSVTVKKYSVIETEYSDLEELRKNSSTEEFLIKYTIHVTNSDGSIDIQEPVLRIPRIINGVFVIEGDLRIPTSTLGNSTNCRVSESSIIINRDLRFDYIKNRPDPMTGWLFPNLPPDAIKYKVFVIDDELNELSFECTKELMEDRPEFFKLDKESKLKLMIKLDLNKPPEYLTFDLLTSLAKLGSDRYTDNIIDKVVLTTADNLMSCLYRFKTRSNILKNMRSKFYSTGTIFLTNIQSAISKYFKVADESSIDIPQKVNPLIFDSLRYKIIFPDYLAYNSTFVDIVDPVNTPINNNVNRLNELNVCSSIKNGYIFIKCYDAKTGEKVELPYLEYLTKNVLSNECYDYENSKIIEGLAEYTYKTRQKVYKVNSLSEISLDLIEPSPDEKLSPTTRLIPMINSSDPARLGMATAMTKQALEIHNSETALVSTGNDELDYLDSTLITKYQGAPGIVESIKNNIIYIKESDTDSVIPYSVNEPIITANDSLVTFECNCKVGDLVNQGDIIVIPKLIRNKTYNLGINTNVFYINYLGYTHEDGIVISESYSKKLVHYSVIDLERNIKPTDILSDIIKIGSKVKSLDKILEIQSELRAKSSIRNAYISKGKGSKSSLMEFLDLKYDQNNLIVPNNIEEGYIVDILINKNKSVPSVSEVTKETINNFNPNSVSQDYSDIPVKYKELRCMPSEIKDKYCANIKIKIIVVNNAKIKNKLCNRYGSKGEISLVLPDHLMPRLDLDGKGNGPIADLLMNPPSVISRKNPSQLYELILTKIIYKIYDDIGNLISSNKISEAKKYTQALYGNKFLSLSDKDFIDKYNKGVTEFKINVGSYSKLNYNFIKKLMKLYNVKEKNHIYAPDIIIEDPSRDSKRCYSPEEYKSTGARHKLHELGFIEGEVETGSEYMMKLYHAADYSGKVTSSVKDSDQPLMGKGLYRESGQKIGEMEIWSLLSHGAEGILKYGESDRLRSQYSFLTELMLAGYVLLDPEGTPFLSTPTSTPKL